MSEILTIDWQDVEIDVEVEYIEHDAFKGNLWEESYGAEKEIIDLKAKGKDIMIKCKDSFYERVLEELHSNS